MWRKLVAALIAVAAIAAIYRVVIVPWRCNVIEGTVARSTDLIASEADPFRVRNAAERNVAMLERCIDLCKTDVQLPALAAANLTILGRSAAAAAMYERALQSDQRPELFLRMAEAQLAAGDREAGVRSLITAGDFAGKDYVLTADDVLARMEAYNAVSEHEARAAAARGEAVKHDLDINGDFDSVSRRGRTATDTGSGIAWVSAAEAWSAYANIPTTVTTTLTRSTRRTGRRMLRVQTGARDSGIFQAWGEARGLAPARTLTTAWVFVRSGQVYVGTGNGAATGGDAYSTTTGRWEQLKAQNVSCPATQTVLYAASEKGADFDVDLVEVNEVPGPPCLQ